MIEALYITHWRDRPAATRLPVMDRRGLALCTLSAVLFGTTAVFVELADRAGVGMAALLAGRFTLATAALGGASAAALIVNGSRRGSRTVGGRRRAFALGAVLASVQTALLLVAILRLGP